MKLDFIGATYISLLLQLCQRYGSLMQYCSTSLLRTVNDTMIILVKTLLIKTSLIKLFTDVIYDFLKKLVFVHGKRLQSSLTNSGS